MLADFGTVNMYTHQLSQPLRPPEDLERLSANDDAAVSPASRAKRGTGLTAKRFATLLSIELAGYLGHPCEVKVENLKLRRQSVRGRKFESAAWTIDISSPATGNTLRILSWATIKECLKAKRLSFSPYGVGLDALPSPLT
jgi:hypothetical protein